MKQLLLLILLVIVPFFLKAQSFTVSADKMNIAYIGIENPLTIVSDNCSCKDLFATTDNGTLTKTDSCRFIYSPTKMGQTVIIIQKKQNGKLVKIGEQVLRCKGIPDPRVAISNKSSGIFPLEQFKVQQGISVVFEPGFELDLKAMVTSFKIILVYTSTQYAEEITGNRFTAKTIAQINLLKPGDNVFVENIKCKGPDNTIRSMNPLVLTMR